MKLLISEILDKIEATKDKKVKKELFKQYESPCLRGLMRINFDDSSSMGLPEGKPPYKKDTDKPIGHSHSILEVEYRKFYIWLTPGNLSQTKREMLFIQMLEGLHHTEADLLCLIKDKALRQKYPSITADMIREVFPGTLPPKEEKPAEVSTFREDVPKANIEDNKTVGVEVKTVDLSEEPVKRKKGRPARVKQV